MIITTKNNTGYLKILSDGKNISSNENEESREFAASLIRQYKEAGYNDKRTFGLDRKPQFSYRGFMLDTSRHFFKTEGIKRIIYLISLFGGNIFHWHLTDDQGFRFKVPEYEKSVTVGSVRKDPDYKGYIHSGFYSDEEIKEVVDYATSLNVVIVPEIETPGHSTAIISAYKELGCTGKQIEVESSFGIFEDVLNPASEKVYTFLDAAISHLARLFPGPFIHIGGDECPHTQWKENKDVLALMKREKLETFEEVQGYMTTKVANIVIRHNKRPIAWDEALSSTNIPTSLVIMNWRDPQLAIDALKRGHDVIMCPFKNSYLDYKSYDSELEPGNLSVATVKDFFSVPLIPAGYKKDFKGKILGGQANLWTEKVYSIRQAEYMMFPRLIAFFEALENYDERNWDDFKAKRKEILNLLLDLGIAFYPGAFD